MRLVCLCLAQRMCALWLRLMLHRNVLLFNIDISELSLVLSPSAILEIKVTQCDCHELYTIA